jgi:hypothetical protein
MVSMVPSSIGMMKIYCTSNDGDAALYDVFRFLIKVKIVRSDPGMDTGLVKIALHHFQEA